MDNRARLKIEQLFRAIDGLFTEKWADLVYEEVSVSIEGDHYGIKIWFDEKKNVKAKIRFLSRLAYVKEVERREGQYIVVLKVPIDGEIDFKRIPEHDSSKEAWKFYRCRYGNHLDMDEFVVRGKRFKAHGEVDFNFGLDKSAKTDSMYFYGRLIYTMKKRRI